MELLAEGWVTAGAFAHPTFLDEGHFKNIQREPVLEFASLRSLTAVDCRRRRVCQARC